MSIITNKNTVISRDERIVLDWIKNTNAFDDKENLLFRRISNNVKLMSKEEISLLARLITDETLISKGQASLLNIVIKNKSL